MDTNGIFSDISDDILSDGLPKILPPSENGIFRSVLTLPESYIALVSSVAAFLDRPVMSVTLRNNDAPARDRNAKQEEYDINCVVDGADGDQCDVEMQASHMDGDNKDNDHRNLKWRSVHNLSHLHSNQEGRGKPYGSLVRSYQVMLCNYKIFSFENDLVERFTLRNPKGTELCDAVSAIFIDLTRAREIAEKPVNEMSDIEVWVVFFALAHRPEYSGIITEITKSKEGVAVAYNTLLNISQSPEERARFNSRRMWLQDREHEHAVWKEEGRTEGRREGQIEGRREGRLDEKIKIARDMKAEGMSVEIIARLTKLSVAEIEKL